jgi:hypothetical protein
MTQKLINGLLALGIVVVGTFAAFIHPQAGQTATPGEQHTGGGIQQNLEWSFANGIQIGSNHTNWLPTQTLTRGVDRVSYTNTTGRTLYVTLGEADLVANDSGTATASSTYRVRMFATSTASLAISQNFTAPVPDKYSLVFGTWATSTAATTTNSVGSVPLGGQGVIQLPPDWTLFTYLQAVDAAGCAGAGKCEAATSTNRGFNVKVRAQYHFDD